MSLRSAEKDYAKNVRPSVGDHPRPQALSPYGEQPEQAAEERDSCHRAHSFVEMANAE